MTVVIFDSHGVEHVRVEEDSLGPLGISAGSSPSLFLVLQETTISNLTSLLNGVSPAESGASLGS